MSYMMWTVVCLLVSLVVAGSQPASSQKRGKGGGPAPRAVPRLRREALPQRCRELTKAVPLLRWRVNPFGGMELETDSATLNYLETLEGEVSVVSMIGPHKSGRSFLLNQLLPFSSNDDGQGPKAGGEDAEGTADGWGEGRFEVHDTKSTNQIMVYIVPPCARPIEDLKAFPEKAHLTLMFLDTPPLFLAGPDFDSQMLAVVNLLSSIVVYSHVDGPLRLAVDGPLLAHFSHAITGAFDLSYFEQGEPSTSELAIARPMLLYVLQNYAPFIAIDYEPFDIMKALAVMDSYNPTEMKFLPVYERFFSSIDAVPLPYPIEGMQQGGLQTNVAQETFTEPYLQHLDFLRTDLLLNSEAKRFGEHRMNARIFASVVREWSVAMENGMKFHSHPAEFLQHINEKALEQATERYHRWMLEGIELPLPDKALLSRHRSVMDRLMHPKHEEEMPGYLTQMREMMTESYVALQEHNEETRRAKGEQHVRLAKAATDWNDTMRAYELPMNPSRLRARLDELKEAVMKASADWVDRMALEDAFNADMSTLLQQNMDSIAQALQIQADAALTDYDAEVNRLFAGPPITAKEFSRIEQSLSMRAMVQASKDDRGLEAPRLLERARTQLSLDLSTRAKSASASLAKAHEEACIQGVARLTGGELTRRLGFFVKDTLTAYSEREFAQYLKDHTDVECMDGSVSLSSVSPYLRTARDAHAASGPGLCRGVAICSVVVTYLTCIWAFLLRYFAMQNKDSLSPQQAAIRNCLPARGRSVVYSVCLLLTLWLDVCTPHLLWYPLHSLVVFVFALSTLSSLANICLSARSRSSKAK